MKEALRGFEVLFDMMRTFGCRPLASWRLHGQRNTAVLGPTNVSLITQANLHERGFMHLLYHAVDNGTLHFVLRNSKCDELMGVFCEHPVCSPPPPP